MLVDGRRGGGAFSCSARLKFSVSSSSFRASFPPPPCLLPPPPTAYQKKRKRSEREFPRALGAGCRVGRLRARAPKQKPRGATATHKACCRRPHHRSWAERKVGGLACGLRLAADGVEIACRDLSLLTFLVRAHSAAPAFSASTLKLPHHNGAIGHDMIGHGYCRNGLAAAVSGGG